ncbi:hypothetical protein Tco_1428796 [Tanacetum coccineum]
MIKDVDPMLDNITVQAKNSGKLPLLPHKYKLNFYKGTVVTRIDPFDNNVNNVILEPFNRLLDGTRRHYHEHKAVDVIGLVIVTGDVVPVQSVVGHKIRRTMVIGDADVKELPEYDEFKIEVFTPQEPVVTITEFFHRAVKKMVAIIRECRHNTHCIVYARIHKLHKENGWGYTACKECNRKVDVVKSKASSSSGKASLVRRPLFFQHNDQQTVWLHYVGVDGKHGMDVDEYWPEELGKVVEASGSSQSSGSDKKQVWIDLDDIDSEEEDEGGSISKILKLVSVKIEKEKD